MAENVKKKISRRRGHRLYVRNVITNVKQLILDLNEENIYKLQSYKVSLQKQQQLIEPLDNDRAELLDEESIEKEIVEKCEFDNALEEIICLISSVLKNQEESRKSIESESQQENVSAPAAPSVSNRGGASASSASAVVSVSSGENTAAKVSKAKLPKLTLPKFDGCPASWASFLDCFASAVHENSQLDNTEKFQYLKSLLEKTAAETISGLPLTSSQTTWRLLNF